MALALLAVLVLWDMRIGWVRRHKTDPRHDR